MVPVPHLLAPLLAILLAFAPSSSKAVEVGTTSAGLSAERLWRRGEPGDPGSLDPHKATTVIESHILTELYEGLVILDAGGHIQPGVAKSWSISEDGRLYRFRLREDARWSNGDPVTAQDFVYAFRRLMDPATGAPYANILYTLKNAEKVNKGLLPPESLGVTAIADNVLEITLEEPVPYLIAQLAHLTAKPLHRRSIEATRGDFVHPGRVVTNGPFMLADFNPNDRLVLVKNPHHYDAAAISLDKEIFIPLEDRSAALRRFLAGEIDSYSDVPVDQIAFVRKIAGERFKLSPNLGTYVYAFDTRHPPFDDVRVRTALSLAIDREFLAERIWGGTMEPGYSFVPPGIESYGPPAELAFRHMTPFEREDRARALLAEAGYDPGGQGSKKVLKAEIRFNISENHRATAIAVADMWKRIGVETSLVATDATSHYAFMRERPPYSLLRYGWFADFPDAQNFLFLAESGNKGLNISGFSNSAYDALMHDAAGEADATKRTALLHQAEMLLLQEGPYLPLMIFKAKNLVSPKLHGWHENALDTHPGRFISIDP